MKAYVAILLHVLALIVTLKPVEPRNWITESFQKFVDEETNKMEKFFQEQKYKTNKLQKSIDNFFGVNSENLSSEFSEIEQKFEDSSTSKPNVQTESGHEDSFTSKPYVKSVPTAVVNNPDVHLTVPAIIARNGYQCETHTVVSKGYLLNIHRIPRSKNSGVVPAKTILLQHGMLASSADWVLNGPEKSLAFVLADAGYDVWMPNIRGNRYSREYAEEKIDNKVYWDFSWHDVALHDVPAVIDYIMKVKGEDTKITYVGHSMGTTILFAMLTLRPEYNTKLTAGFALAPVVFFKNLKSPIKTLAPIASTVGYMEMLYGSHEFTTKNSALSQMSGSCTGESVDSSACKDVLFYICGHNEKQFNKTLLPAVMAHLGIGTSWKTVLHFSQEISSGKFQQYDYGFNNYGVYGTMSPPQYDLSKITLPIKLFWSKNDLLSSEEDVKLLHSKLPASAEMYMIPDKEYNHLDYLYAIDNPTLLNNQVIRSLNKTFSDTS